MTLFKDKEAYAEIEVLKDKVSEQEKELHNLRHTCRQLRDSIRDLKAKQKESK